MVTHDPRYAEYADRTIHLFDGRVVDTLPEGHEHAGREMMAAV
jgi:putative ABC transport system ATP-binding protein